MISLLGIPYLVQAFEKWNKKSQRKGSRFLAFKQRDQTLKMSIICRGQVIWGVQDSTAHCCMYRLNQDRHYQETKWSTILFWVYSRVVETPSGLCPCVLCVWLPAGLSVEVRLLWKSAASSLNDHTCSIVAGTDALSQGLVRHQLGQETWQRQKERLSIMLPALEMSMDKAQGLNQHCFS